MLYHRYNNDFALLIWSYLFLRSTLISTPGRISVRRDSCLIVLRRSATVDRSRTTCDEPRPNSPLALKPTRERPEFRPELSPSFDISRVISISDVSVKRKALRVGKLCIGRDISIIDSREGISLGQLVASSLESVWKIFLWRKDSLSRLRSWFVLNT